MIYVKISNKSLAKVSLVIFFLGFLMGLTYFYFTWQPKEVKATNVILNATLHGITDKDITTTNGGQTWTSSPEDYTSVSWGWDNATDLNKTIRGILEINTSIIPDGSIITNVNFSYYSEYYNQGTNITEIEIRPSTAPNNATIAEDIANGTVYVSSGFPLGSPPRREVDLGPNADTKMQNLLTSDWFAIGFLAQQEVQGTSTNTSAIYSKEITVESYKYWFNITYTPPDNPPTYSTNATNSTIAGTPINHTLSWSDDNGLSGYIFSTNNSGTWVNASLVIFSGTSNTSWNVTTSNSTIGTVIEWCFYTNDTSNQWNGTSCSNPFTYLTTSGQINLTTCDNLNQSTTYILLNNVSSDGTCFKMVANGITLDCDGYWINYSKVSTGHAIDTTDYNNTTIKNCNIVEGKSSTYSRAIQLNNSSNSTVYNNTITTYTDFSYGVNILEGANNNNISYNTINSGSTAIHTWDENGDSVVGNIIHNNNLTSDDDTISIDTNPNTTIRDNVIVSGNRGIIVVSSTADNTLISGNNITAVDDAIAVYGDIQNTTIKDNRLTSNSTGYGVSLTGGVGGAIKNKIYNNLINGSSVPIELDNPAEQHDWNTTNQIGTRIEHPGLEPSYIGGNYYTNSTGNGYSDTCTDSNTDGYCDSALNISNMKSCTPGVNCGNNVDYLAYSDEYLQYLQYSNPSTNNTVAGQSTLFSLYWTDDLGLSHYRFSFDNCTGIFVNDSWSNSGWGANPTAGWSNTSKVINSTIGCTMRWKYYANDTGGNEAVSSEYSFVTIETTPPTWSNNQSSIGYVNEYSHFNVTWTDETGFSMALFNLTFGELSNQTMANTYGGNIYNYSVNITSEGNYTWLSYGNDTSNNQNVTDTWIFTVESTSTTTSTSTSTSTSTTSESTSSSTTTTSTTTTTINPSIAYTINRFNDSTTSKNLTFSSNQTAYVNMPKYAYVTDARLNVSGYVGWDGWNDTEENYTVSGFTSGVVDENWDTCSSPGGTAWVVEEYTPPDYANKIMRVKWYSKFLLYGVNSYYNVSVWNYTSSNWMQICNEEGTLSGTKYCDITFNNSEVVGNGKMFKINTSLTHVGGAPISSYCEGKVDFEGRYPTNVSLDVSSDGDYDWSYSGELNSSNSPQRTDDFSSELNDYLWTCTAVSGNCTIPLVFHSDTAGILQIDDLNITYYEGYNYQVEYTGTVFETQTDTIKLLIKSDSTIENASLIYNGMKYSPSSSSSGDSHNFTKTVTVPTFKANANVSFYWNFSLDGMTINTDTYYQEVLNISLTDCTGDGTKAITFYTLSETNETYMNATVEASFNVWFSEASNITYYFNFQGNYTYSICIIPSYASYLVDAHIESYADGYRKRTYFLDDATISNATQTINLYLINETESSGITIHVLDQTGTKTSDAYMKIQRYYLNGSLYKTVTITKTDSEGISYTYLEMYNIWYKFIIEKGGKVLYEAPPMLIKDTEFTITIPTGILPEWYNYYGKIGYSCTENNATGLIRCTVTDTSGLVHEVCLKVSKMTPTTETIECNICESYSSAVTLTCTVGNMTGNVYFYSLWVKFADWTAILNKWLDFRLTMWEKVGGQGVIASAILVGTTALVGVFNPIIAIILGLTSLGIAMTIGFIKLEMGAFISIVVVGILIIYRMVKS